MTSYLVTGGFALIGVLIWLYGKTKARQAVAARDKASLKIINDELQNNKTISDHIASLSADDIDERMRKIRDYQAAAQSNKHNGS
jgi:hypothetical protein